MELEKLIEEAESGFVATKESTGERYLIYYTTVERAKQVYYDLSGFMRNYNDVFFGYADVYSEGAAFDRIFA